MIRIVRFEASRFIKECEEKSCSWAEQEYDSLEQQIAYYEGVEDFTEYLSGIFKTPKKKRKILEVSFCNLEALSHTCSKSACKYAEKYKSVTEQLAYRNGAAKVFAELYKITQSTHVKNQNISADNFSPVICFVFN